MGARSDQLTGFEGTVAWSLLESVPDAIVIVAGSGDIVFANDMAGRMLGYEPADLLDHPVESLLPEALRSVHRADRIRYRVDPVARSMGSDLLLTARRADGSEFPVEISLSPWHHNEQLLVMAAIRDVSERVEADDHMHRVLHTLDASDDGVFIFDADDLRYSFVNEGAARLVGYTRNELIGLTPLHLNPHTCEADYRDVIRSLQDQPLEPVVHRATLRRKDGSEVCVEKTYKSAPVGRTGARWVIALARDITARLSAEDRLRTSELALRRAERDVAVGDDRERIARDLHDTVIQRLFGAGMNLQATAATADDRTRARIETTIDDLDATIRELRSAIFSLQRRAVSPLAFRAQILDVVGACRSALSADPRVEFEGPIESIDVHVAQELLAILREALTNVGRHAGASAVVIELHVSATTIRLVVGDDGIGMTQAPSRRPSGGDGLPNIEARAKLLGGTLDIGGGPVGGTLLVVTVPHE